MTALLATSAPYAAHAELARPDLIADRSLRFDQTVSVMAHNAYNNSGFLPQQKLSVAQQLNRGVRGFMLDVHKSNGVLKVCHGSCSSFTGRVAPLQEDLGTIHNFLVANPHAIITVHLEVSKSVGRNDMDAFVNNYGALLRYAFDPYHGRWTGHRDWPTVAEMVEAEQRLLVMHDRADLTGKYGSRGSYMFYDQSVLVQNTFSIGATVGTHDHSCSSRWPAFPLDTRTGIRHWNRLFLMNHFHTAPYDLHADLDNRWDRIESRILDRCGPAAGREPNFIGVDFVERGDVLEYVEKRNNGGITAYEGDGAGQDVVCGFSTVVGRSWSLQGRERLGCENDEMRSLVLQGMKKGQRVMFYDRPDGYRDDDFGILNIDEDIAWDNPQVLYSLERSVRNPYFRYLYSGGNGLSGKVSRITVDPTPTPMSDASFTLHRESGGNGRVSCGFGATRSGFWNLKKEKGCHNDDARSMRILVADQGTTITVYDSPSGSQSDDYTVVQVKRPIIYPVVIADLQGNQETPDISVKHYRKNGLNGKVSSVRLHVPGR